MTIAKQSAHQWSLSTIVVIEKEDILDGANAVICELPADAVVTGGYVGVNEKLDDGSETANTVAVTVKAASDIALLAATDTYITAGGKVDLVPTAGPIGVVANVEIDIAVTGGTGAPTAGQYYVVIEYVRTERATEIR